MTCSFGYHVMTFAHRIQDRFVIQQSPFPDRPITESLTRPKVYSGEEHSEIAIPVESLMHEHQLDLYPEIRGRDYFQLRFRNDKLVFQAGGYIGVIPVNPRVTIEVKSRVPVANLERILRIADYKLITLRAHKRWFASHVEQPESLIDILADEFIESVEDLREKGVLKSYVRDEGVRFQLKGRLQTSQFLRRRARISQTGGYPCSWFDRTADVPANQCIKYTIWFLAQKYARMHNREGAKPRLSKLNKLYNYFPDVKFDVSASFLALPSLFDPRNIPSTRTYYSRTLAIAHAILRGRGLSFSTQGQEFALGSLIINMEEVFEAYLRAVLADRLDSGSVTVLDGNHSGSGGARKRLFEDSPPKGTYDSDATPDIVIAKRSKALAESLVMDSKYKIIRPLASREDINQVITYALSYSSTKAVLVYPFNTATEKGLNLLGRIGDVSAYQYVFDLGAVSIEEEEARFTEAVRNLTPQNIPL